jgi:hypothetical protein
MNKRGISIEGGLEIPQKQGNRDGWGTTMGSSNM